MSWAFDKLKAYTGLGHEPLPPRDILQAANVPVTDADCRTCDHPCDQEHEEYPKFLANPWIPLLGTVQRHSRQIIISSGKTDWAPEVTEVACTLATSLRALVPDKVNPKKLDQRNTVSAIPGVYTAEDTSRIQILCGSHRTNDDDDSLQTILSFPEYTMTTGVHDSDQGARDFLNGTDLSHGVLENTSVLPYSVVILLCSHRRRDKKCGVTAGPLRNAFTKHLEYIGWTVDCQPDCEDISSPGEDMDTTKKSLRKLNRALILFTSHIGGHQFAGNCIIHTPQGSSVWYGRITPHHVDAIVRETIVEGKILPDLFRGGLNLSKPGPKCENIYQW